jgi:hypothetical protein
LVQALNHNRRGLATVLPSAQPNALLTIFFDLRRSLAARLGLLVITGTIQNHNSAAPLH